MDVDERAFVTSVRRRADLDSDEAARAATRATLETLGERLTAGEVDDLAALLPAALAESLTTYGEEPGAFSFEAFLDRVDERAVVEGADPLAIARAVGVTFADAVGERELADARAQLPPEYDRLFWAVDAEEFLATVRRHADLESTAALRTATMATLHVLGGRLSRGEAERLAAYLPAEFAAALEAAGTEATAYDVTEFVDRVARRERAEGEASELADRTAADEGIDTDEVRAHIRAVFAALADAVPPDEFADALQQLPADFGPLLELVEHGGNRS